MRLLVLCAALQQYVGYWGVTGLVSRPPIDWGGGTA